MEYINECYTEVLLNRLGTKVTHIRNSLLDISKNPLHGLKMANFITKRLSDVSKDIYSDHDIHDIYVMDIIVSRIVEGDSFAREILVYELENELMDMPYAIIMNQRFIQTLQDLMLATKLPAKLDQNLLEKLIHKDV